MDATHTVVKCNQCHEKIDLRPDQIKRLKSSLTLQDVCPHCRQTFNIDLMKRPSLPPTLPAPPQPMPGYLPPTMPPPQPSAPAAPAAPPGQPPFGMLDQVRPQDNRLPPFAPVRESSKGHAAPAPANPSAGSMPALAGPRSGNAMDNWWKSMSPAKQWTFLFCCLAIVASIVILLPIGESGDSGKTGKPAAKSTKSSSKPASTSATKPSSPKSTAPGDSPPAK